MFKEISSPNLIKKSMVFRLIDAIKLVAGGGHACFCHITTDIRRAASLVRGGGQRRTIWYIHYIDI